MKVTVSVFGNFHAFELAKQLERRQALTTALTTYPLARTGLERANVTSMVVLEGLERLTRKLVRDNALNAKRHFVLREAYDRLAARQLPEDSDLFVGWSGCSEHSILAASRRGIRTVVERGSSHIQFQDEILREEFSRQGGDPALPSKGTIEKELREYEAADAIMVPSRYARDTFVDRGVNPEKIRVVPYGVDVSQFTPAEKPPGIFRVLFVGAMSLQKGIPYLLQAFDELQLDDAELWLVGRKLPEIEPAFRKYEGSYRFFGPQPQAKLPAFYQQCSVFVMPSIQEGMAMVQLQALASGLPLICTTNTGGEDLIENGKEGFVIPIRDVDAVKQRILALYHDRDLLAMMSKAASRKARQANSWDDYGDQVVNVYAELLSSRQGG